MSVRNPSSLANLLLTFFDFSYFLLFTPFRYDGNLRISRWWPQRIACAIVSLSGYFYDIYFYHAIYLDGIGRLSRNPIQYFKLLREVFTTCLHINAHILFWRHAERCTKIFNFLSSTTDLPIPSNSV